MRIFPIVTLLFSFASFASSSGPMDCYRAASQDRVIKHSSHLKVRLCRGAVSTVPYKCFESIYTNGQDFRVGSSLAVTLCKGAVDPQAPIACFNEVLEQLRGQIFTVHAIKLCAGSGDVQKALGCFERARNTLDLDRDEASELCSHSS